MTHDFGEWLRHYPKRNRSHPREPAERAWNRLLKAKKLLPQEQMIADAKRFSAECLKDRIYGTCFVPHASTYLNQLRFVPEPCTVPTPPQHPMILPEGYEDYARLLVNEIGVPAYTAWFGRVKWSNGGDVIRLSVESGFEREKIAANYVIPLERLTGKKIQIEP